MRIPIRKYALIALNAIVVLCPVSAMADAIMRSEAMFADTIAEYFVEDDHVRPELEIGSNDVNAFRNLLPDALYQRLGHGNLPLNERLSKFAAEDMPVLAGGEKLTGRITSIGPGTRPLRDQITGEELPTPDDQAVLVVRATVMYPFDERPDALSFVTPLASGPMRGCSRS